MSAISFYWYRWSLVSTSEKSIWSLLSNGDDSDYSLYPAVKETLSVLAQAGYSMAVVTNKPDQFVQPLLQSAGIAEFFTYTLGGGRLPVKKPDPLPLHYLCEQFNVQPAETLMVGDSKNDIQAARAAGIPVVGLSYGYNHGEPIENSEPDWVLHRFDELVSLLNAEVRNWNGKTNCIERSSTIGATQPLVIIWEPCVSGFRCRMITIVCTVLLICTPSRYVKTLRLCVKHV